MICGLLFSSHICLHLFIHVCGLFQVVSYNQTRTSGSSGKTFGALCPNTRALTEVQSQTDILALSWKAFRHICLNTSDVFGTRERQCWMICIYSHCLDMLALIKCFFLSSEPQEIAKVFFEMPVENENIDLITGKMDFSGWFPTKLSWGYQCTYPGIFWFMKCGCEWVTGL